ncbi:hypothetical protein BST61_g5316 [Cercospora zeina]
MLSRSHVVTGPLQSSQLGPNIVRLREQYTIHKVRFTRRRTPFYSTDRATCVSSKSSTSTAATPVVA